MRIAASMGSFLLWGWSRYRGGGDRILRTVVVMCCFVLTGCASAQILHDKQQARLYADLQQDRVLLKKFRECSFRPYGDPSNAATGDAEPGEAVPAPSMRPLQRLINNSSLKDDEDIAELLQVISDLANPSQHKIDFHPHVGRLKKVMELAKRFHSRVRLEEDKLIKEGKPFEQLLVAYNRAYFGEIKFSASGGKSGAKGVVKTTSAGFVDRNGNAFAFPGLSVEVSLGSDRTVHLQSGIPDSKRISSDLVRIFLEAFFDAAFRTPAERSATALQVDWKTDSPYPMFDAERLPIAMASFEKVSRDSLRAEAAVISAVGRAIRGGGMFGINNEALAAGIETAAGVIAKKVVEHETFCYFLVTNRPEQAQAEEDVKVLAEGNAEKLNPN
ncbi:MAG: hypothetical protein ABJB49_08755 [Nitrospirota bacterium]